MRHSLGEGVPQGAQVGDMKVGQSAFFAHATLPPHESGGSTMQFS
jgi:hypothetical protein